MPIAISDLATSLGKWRLWFMLAADEWRIRYHRTLLGPVWIILSFAAFILVKIVVFQNMSSADPAYFSAYLIIGFLVWLFIQQSLNEGSMALVRNRNWILGVKAPISIHFFSQTAQQLLNLVFNCVAGLALVYWVYPFDLAHLPLALLGLLGIAFSIFWAQMLLGILSVFIRDLMQLTQTVTRMMLFLTPIFWMPDQFPEPPVFYTYNPFTYYLNLIRDLVFTGTTSWLNIQVVAGLTVAMMILSVVLLQLTARRIPSHI